GAGITVIVPALKVTSGVGARLREATAGGGGLRFGGVWIAIIVTQIALTVAFPALAYYVKRDASRIEAVDIGVPMKDYLTLRVEMDREPPPGAPADTTPAAFMSRFQRTYGELARRLTNDPAVVSVASAERLPLMYHPHRLVDVDSGGAAPLRAEGPASRVSSARVDPDFFTVFDAAAIAGRTFHSGDVTPDDLPIGVAGAEPGVVVVNEAFVRLVLGGRNPIGRRIRYVSFEDREPRTVEDVEDAPWYEIVGVVRDLGMAVGAHVGQRGGGDLNIAGIYYPMQAGGVYPATLAIRVNGDPQAFVPQLRTLATAADPTLRLYDVMSLD